MAPNALAKSRMTVPRKLGQSTGITTIRQYWLWVAPRVAAASPHSRFMPSMAGTMITTISGIWK